MTPLSLYLHIPFCKAKCNYCNFISSSADEQTIDNYINCLIAEIQMNKSKLKAFGVDTIFIGGGTPSILTKEQLSKLLFAIKSNIQELKPLEFTFELNPESMTKDKLQTLKEYGVNRLSIGLQTANDSELKLLGRIHNYEQFQSSYKLARDCGFDNISVDLMFAFPNQTMKSFENTLNLVTKLEPAHISCYSLIIEEDTKLAYDIEQHHLKELTEDEYINMYRNMIKLLEEKGYFQYEISNFSKKDFSSRHNIGYWTHKNYLGLGVAAHSFIEGVRFSNTENIKEYITKLQKRYSPVEFHERLNTVDLFDETIMLGLRMNEGIKLSNLKEQFDLGDTFYYRINKLKERGLLQNSDTHIKLTQEGRELSNTVILELVK